MVVIFIFIIISNVIMQKHTDYVTTELDASLNSLRESVKNENKDMANAQYEEIVKQWDKDKKSFNMYIEHAEIEKVEMYLVEIKSHLETEEYAMAIESIDMCDFMIEHTKEKYKFCLKNIF